MADILPRIAIVGRPNVGKSTLFNRIAGRRRALVGDEPGMTRDRIYAVANWKGKQFEVVDTGGIIPQTSDIIESEILRQAEVAIREADYLILVADARSGLVPLDEELAGIVRRSGKPSALALNKVDAPKLESLAADFSRLGFDHCFTISAEHALGVDALLDHIVEAVSLLPEAVAAESSPPEQTVADNPERVDIAIIGRPNTGKSTLLNKLLNEERSIVSDIPGTTRDAVDAELEHGGIRFRFVDTAGLRRKGKTNLMIEKLSVIQARKHLEEADLALLMMDAREGVNALDAHIAGYAHESRRSVILVVNKWDAVEQSADAREEFTDSIRRRMKFLEYAPIVFISSLTGQGMPALWRVITRVAAARRHRVPTSELNRFLETVDFARAPSFRGRRQRIHYLTQITASPPAFAVFVSGSRKVHFAFERFLQNRLRERFGFEGSPIVIKWRLKEKRT